MQKAWLALTWIATWIALCALTANAQQPRTAPEFEAASVKPAPPESKPARMRPPELAAILGFNGGPGTKDPGRIDYSNVTLQMLLARAYQVKPNQISGPGWLETERYIIAAKLPPGTDADGLRLMLQKLLTERFQISLHRETKDMPVYRLKGAKNGPKLKPPEVLPQYQNDDEQNAANKKRLEDFMAKARASREAMARNGVKPQSYSGFGLSSATTEKLAEVLSSHLDRPVKDMTQLEGKYSINLQWTPEKRTERGRR